MKIDIEIGKNGKMPTKAHPNDAGWDIFSSENVIISGGEIRKVSTDIKIAMEDGWECQVRSKSGLASGGLVVVNSPGTIDAGYRGEILVLLYNIKPIPFVIEKGQKIAQLVFQKVEEVQFQPKEQLNVTQRNESGFGSSGKT